MRCVHGFEGCLSPLCYEVRVVTRTGHDFSGAAVAAPRLAVLSYKEGMGRLNEAEAAELAALRLTVGQ